MTLRRTYPLMAILLLVACTSPGTTSPTATAQEPAETATAEPELDSPEPSAEEVATITMDRSGGAVGGPGASVADAIANHGDEPTLVNGYLLRDRDDVIWLCDELTDTSPPDCAEPRLRVEGYPDDAILWHPEDGELVNLEEEDGVYWIPPSNNQMYGVIEP